MQSEFGLLSLSPGGGVMIKAVDEEFFIPSDDLLTLVGGGKIVPVSKHADSDVIIAGHARQGGGGSAYLFYTTGGEFILPHVSLGRVLDGRAAAATLFPLDEEGKR